MEGVLEKQRDGGEERITEAREVKNGDGSEADGEGKRERMKQIGIRRCWRVIKVEREGMVEARAKGNVKVKIEYEKRDGGERKKE